MTLDIAGFVTTVANGTCHYVMGMTSRADYGSVHGETTASLNHRPGGIQSTGQAKINTEAGGQRALLLGVPDIYDMYETG